MRMSSNHIQQVVTCRSWEQLTTFSEASSGMVYDTHRYAPYFFPKDSKLLNPSGLTVPCLSLGVRVRASMNPVRHSAEDGGRGHPDNGQREDGEPGRHRGAVKVFEAKEAGLDLRDFGRLESGAKGESVFRSTCTRTHNRLVVSRDHWTAKVQGSSRASESFLASPSR